MAKAMVEEARSPAWLDARVHSRLTNWMGVEVGAVRAGEALQS